MIAKKKVLIYLAISVLCILILPISNFIFTTSLSELQKLKISEVQKKLFSLDLITTKFNKILYYSGVNVEYSDVIIGNDGYLFLGIKHLTLKKKYQYGLAEKDAIKKVVNNLKIKQDFLDKNNIKSLIVLVPDKEFIYQNKLPRRFAFKPDVFNNLFLEYSKQENLRVLFGGDFLEPHQYNTYYKMDTHWNHYGSYLGYNKTIDKLNTIYHANLQKIKNPTFSKQVIKGGDLASFLKINNEKDINDEDILWNLPLENYEVNRCEFIPDKEEKFHNCQKSKNITTNINTQSYYTFSKNALNKKKLLWIRDSFGIANSPLYQATFQKIIQIHHGHLNNNTFYLIVEEERPDYVILQVVEREIYSSIYTTE